VVSAAKKIIPGVCEGLSACLLLSPPNDGGQRALRQRSFVRTSTVFHPWTMPSGFAQQFGVDAMIAGDDRRNCWARANCWAKPVIVPFEVNAYGYPVLKQT